MPRRASWTASGGSEGAQLGEAVAGIGDVNGDGFGDMIVGSPDYSGVHTRQGRALVYYGSATGLAATPAWTAEGSGEGAEFGASVAWAGDVNGDGNFDVVIGEPRYSHNGSRVGRARAFYGSPTGLAATPAWTVEGNQNDSYFGHAVAGVLDVNDDGYGDILVSAPYQDAGGYMDAGCAFAYFGSAQGLATTASWTACGETTSASFGYALAPAGDVNNDLVYDILIGSPGYFGDQDREGRVYVYQGATGGLPATPSWHAEGNQASSFFGGTVDLAGDVNGDNYGDIIVGAPSYTATADNEGRVFVYHGSASGLGATPPWTADGGQNWADFGAAVAYGWDVNDDGFTDVIIGAPGYSGDKPAEGRVFVYAGSTTGLGSNPAWAAAGRQTGAWFGDAVGASDFNPTSSGWPRMDSRRYPISPVCGLPSPRLATLSAARIWPGGTSSPATQLMA